MAWWPVFLSLLFLVPPGAAQLLQDPSGDHAAAGFEEGDLLALHARVDEARVHFEIETAGLESPNQMALTGSSTYRVWFSHGEADYQLYLFRRFVVTGPVEGPVHDAYLYRMEDGTRRALEVDVAFGEETGAGVLTASVPRAALLDGRGLPLLPGGALTDLWVESSNEADGLRRSLEEDGYPVPAPTVRDRMPDDGTGGPLEVEPPGPGAALSLLPDPPARASNGGPGTFVFDVHVHNGGRDARDVRLRLEDVPAAWNALVVPASVQVAPGELALVRVVVEAQGRHAHGGQDTLRLVTEGASADLSIHYPEVPQPAGHHDTVWFHSARRSEEGSLTGTVDDAQGLTGYERAALWMNTLEEDPDDDGRRSSTEYLDGVRVWRLVLAPGLALGLRLNNETGEVVVPLTPSGPTDLEGVTLSARLWLDAPAGPVELARAAETEPFGLAADQVREVALPLAAVASSVDHQDGTRLVLDVVLESFATPESSAFSTFVPLLAPGGHARLPLDEYRDPLPPEVRAALEADGVLAENGTLRDPGPAPTGRDSPAPPLAPVVALLALLAVAARRRAP